MFGSSDSISKPFTFYFAMSPIAATLNLAFAFLLVAVVPILSFFNGEMLRRRPLPRLQLYYSGAISQWALSFLGIGIVFFSPLGFSSLGFRVSSFLLLLRNSALFTALSLGALMIFVWLHVRGIWPQESDVAAYLIPRTRREKILAVALVSPTAALCEEFLYRGYLYAFFTERLESSPWAWFLSSVAFGLAHSYQGPGGVLRAGLLGALLAYPVVIYGSIYPAMAAHFIVDVVALAWMGPRFWKFPEPRLAPSAQSTNETEYP